MRVEEIFYQTDIWKHFKSVASDSKVTCVKRLIEYSIPILDRIIETFPTYTLHNGQHQLNILTLYSELLGPRINELTDLEAAILILSAFYHDIGMVFDEDSRHDLQSEELFSLFLSTNPSARLKLEQESTIDNELSEWYCRWSHAERVWVYLDKIDDLLNWEGVNFRKELALVCLSHNESTKFIESDKLPSDYWNNADLKFCAVLLRLADILDFDYSRSPESVYSYLGLDNPKSSSASISHNEWQKHLASKGFDFQLWSKDISYPIYFKATPNHPAVENDIRDFLEIIENELQQCRVVLRSCSQKWRTFALPDKIDKTHIYSQGYTSGEFKFKLDQKQLLNLLMGESLYENSFVFVRELLQNAIDTTRHREKYEMHVRKSSFELKPIEFSTWHDEAGFKWVRVDDYGMGMTLDQIEKYFLKIGNSFYNSDDFEISKIDYPEGEKKFTPISRFGIGILSCFMVGDIIEVSTKSIFCDNKNIHPIRLSLQGIDNYYFLYTDDDIPKEMPQDLKNEKTYRKEFGTSISIRINPNFDREDFEIHNILENLAYASLVPVEYKSSLYGDQQIDELPDKIIKHKISGEDKSRLSHFLDKSIIKEINPEIHRVPIRLINDKTPNASGMLYAFLLRKNLTYKDGHQDHDRERYVYLSEEDEFIDRRVEWSLYFSTFRENEPPSLSLRLMQKSGRVEREIMIPVNELISDLEEFNGNLNYNTIRGEILLSHNGLIVQNNPDYFEKGTKLELSLEEINSDYTFCLGIVNLKDDLRPELNVSRDQILSFPWSCFSQINYLVRTCLEKSKYRFKSEINYFSFSSKYTEKGINNDFLLNSLDGWPSLIEIDNNGTTINNLGKKKYEISLQGRNPYSGDSLVRTKSIFNHCNYNIKLQKKKRENPKKGESSFVLVKKAYLSSPKQVEINSFPTHYVCNYDNFEGLMPLELNQQLYNLEHFFTKWLVLVYSELLNSYPYYLRLILRANSIDELNTILKKLKNLLPEKIQPDFTISERDFDVDFDLLRIAR
ncbi:MAG: HD domain-containing protein [Calditrichia bacterium]